MQCRKLKVIKRMVEMMRGEVMGRPRRIHYPGWIYHVINRGNNRQAIFLEEEDYFKYINTLKRYKKKFKFKLYAYCLMTNHVHLLIQVDEKATISQIMKAITISHTRHYHYKYRTSGHVWQGRFLSPVISNDEYMLRVMCYIEQNPVRARMVKKCLDYLWSSFRQQVSKKQSEFIDRQENKMFMSLGGSERERIEEYKCVNSKILDEKKVKAMQNAFRVKGYYISSKFQEQIQEMLPRKRKRGRPPKSKNRLKWLVDKGVGEF